jgi:catechol 2,3-dioxygenase-like lactoylglutathione lyase family enzyme
MNLKLTGTVLALCLFVGASSSQAQLLGAVKDAPVAYGHHHLNVTSIPAAQKFFVDTLGGTPITVGGRQIVKFPNVFVFLREQKPTAGTKGSSVDHIGFGVPDLRVMVDKIKAAGYRMVTKEEAPSPPWVAADDIATQPGRDVRIAFAMGPDDLKVEIVEVKTQTMPIALHHLHFASPDNTAMRDWYVKVFGAKPGNPGGTFESATLPGVSLNVNKAPAGVAGTQGRTVDHIGFEITNLPAFLKNLEAMGIKPANVRDVPDLGLSIAFITDPWGTYIELTEGLKKIQ